MQAIRTAVIGAGHFGRYHAEKYATEDAAQLVAVVDNDADRAAEVAGKHGARGLTDYRALVGEVDAVSVATPTAQHHEVAAFFLDSGVHVLVEKPFTSTVEQADDLIARASARNLVLQVGHLERFFFAESGLMQSVTRPVYIEALRISPFRPRGSDVSVVLDLMIHDIDLVAALVGAPIVSVEAVGAPVLSDHEDIVNARLRFETGCVASITASRIAFKAERRFRVFQQDCLLSIDLIERNIARISKTGDPNGENFDVEERKLGQRDALRDEIRAFLDAVATGGTPAVTGEDGREALIIAGRVLDSLRAHLDLLRQNGLVRDAADLPSGADPDHPANVEL